MNKKADLKKYKNKTGKKNFPKTKLINGNKVMTQEGQIYLSQSILNDTEQIQPLQQYEQYAQQKPYKLFQINQEERTIKIINKRFKWTETFDQIYSEEHFLQNVILLSTQATLQNLVDFSKQYWPQLKKLTISQYYEIAQQIRCKINSYGINALLQNQFPMLQHINFNDNQIGNTGFKAIVQSHVAQRLKILKVLHNNITSFGLINLPNTNIGQLNTLILSFNNIGLSGVKLLVKCNLPQLKCLGLSQCEIGSEGARYLSKGNWPNLTQIFINNNYINLDGYDWLLHNNWAKLQQYKKCVYGCICCAIFPQSPGVGIESKDINLLKFVTSVSPNLNIMCLWSSLIYCQLKQFTQLYRNRNVNQSRQVQIQM